MIEYFKEKNIKLTKPRKQIFEIIDSLEDASFKDIEDKCKKSMNKSTIYRVLELFLEKEVITKNIDNNNITYSINKNEHKHYIYCVKCHKKTNIDICPIDEIKDSGYKLLSHQIKINGICPTCQKK